MRSAALAVLVTCGCCATLALACPCARAGEREALELSRTQRELNDDGVRALIDGDPERGIKKFQAALALGPRDVVLVNLGRAYALAGRCDEAVATFDQVAAAPRAADIPEADVLAALERYRAELPRQCPGLVRLVCEPRELRIRVDNEPARECPADALELAPGTHVILAHDTDGTVIGVHSIEVVALETRVLHLSALGARIVEPLAYDALDSAPADADALGTAGWALAGSGAALLASALVVELAALQPDADALRDAAARGDRARYDELRDTIPTLQAVNIGLVSVGAVALLTGSGLLVASWLDDDEVSGDPQPAPEAALMLAPGGVGLRVRW